MSSGACARFAFTVAAIVIWGLLWEPRSSAAQSSVCAEVKIQIDQAVSLERQAFEAVLKIRNGLDGVHVTNIDVNLSIKDPSGANAFGSFYNTINFTSDISGSVLDGTGDVGPSTLGEVHWLIIPSSGAGGSDPAGRQYLVGASISYRMTGEDTDRTVEVIPETITVRPQPFLDLDYFLPGDVYGDDPFTELQEAPVPFTLGVLVTNTGFGPANHLRIESAQPRIVEDGNEQGLLVGFRIDGSYVDDQPSQPSLLIDFGNVEPGSRRIGRWIMTTTLSGQFTEFDAGYAHADELGGELTSLMGDPRTHRLTRDVTVDLPGRDSVRDFLAQPIGADDQDTYRVYESDGQVSDVIQRFDATFSGTTLSFPGQAQGLLVYARQQIGFDGLNQSVQATRSDGRAVPASNVWFSKRRDATGEDWLYHVNLFEAESSSCVGSCTYHLVYGETPANASISGSVYEDTNANGLQDPGEPALTGVGIALANESVSWNTVSGGDGSFSFAGLTGSTYALTVSPLAGYVDGVHQVGSAGGDVGSDGIRVIVLETSEQATGYRFAKVPQTAAQSADLSISGFAASDNVLRENDLFTVEISVANAGPDAADGLAVVGLPPAFDLLSATPSVGSFDAVTRLWSIGTLAPTAGASLALDLRAAAPGQFEASVSVAVANGATIDPAPGNNAASLLLDVRALPEIEIAASFQNQSRVLVFVSCRDNIIGGTSFVPCAQTRAALLEKYLQRRGSEHFVTTSTQEFRDELRSGRWNVYWVDNEPGQLDPAVMDEIDLAVLRGDSLIIDGSHASTAAPYDAWAGVLHEGSRPLSAETVTFNPNPYLAFADIPVSGLKPSYEATTGNVLARYPDDAPAIVFGQHGEGRVFLFAFDLADLLAGSSTYDGLFDQLSIAVRTAIPAQFTARAYIPVGVRLENDGGSGTIGETIGVEPGAYIVAAEPTPDASAPQQVTWQREIAGGGTFEAVVGLRAQGAGTTFVSVDVVDAEAGGSNLAHEELAIPVLGTPDRIAALEIAIHDLPATGDDIDWKRAALGALEEATVASAADDFAVAISALLIAADALDNFQFDATATRIDLAWLLQAFQRAWYEGLLECGEANSPPVLDGGATFLPFGENQGFEMKRAVRVMGGTAVPFSWALGAHLQSPADSAMANHGLAVNQPYAWQLSYDGLGNGTFSFSYAGGSDILVYEMDGANALSAGNGLYLRAEAGGTGGATGISASIDQLDGTPRSDTVGVAGATSITDSSLYYLGRSLADGFDLSGTVTVSGTSILLPSDYQLKFSVRAGTLACRYAER